MCSDQYTTPRAVSKLLPPTPTVKRLLDANRLPHLLLYGPPGTGKTSTILALANEMYGSSRPHMVLELNASDDRGINIVRQEIQDFASSRVLFKYVLFCSMCCFVVCVVLSCICSVSCNSMSVAMCIYMPCIVHCV